VSTKTLRCGPTVLATLADQTVAKVEAYLTDVIGANVEAGTSPFDLTWALHYFNRKMTCVANFYDAACPGPPLIGWLDAIEPTWRREHPLIVAIHDPGEDDHWIAC
jgi:hypothetical protein